MARLGLGLAFAGHGLGHRINTVQDSLGGFGIGHFQPVILVQRDDELQGIDGIEAEAAGPEKGLVIPNFFNRNLQHAILDDHLLNFASESGGIMHIKSDEKPEWGHWKSATSRKARLPEGIWTDEIEKVEFPIAFP
jgi:hypothetical protein